MTFRWSEWRRATLLCQFGRLVSAAIAHLFVSCGHEDKDYEFSFCTSYEFIAHWLCIVAAFRRRRAGVRT
jgi:hypothetical protein